MYTIVFYGDSNTWGHTGWKSNRRHPPEQRFTGIVQKAFPQCRVVEEGLPGRNISFDHPIEPFDNGARVLPMLLTTHDPIDLIVIMLGVNDSMTLFNNSLYNIRYAMERTIQLIQSPSQWSIIGSKAPKILLIAPPRMHDIENSPYFGQYDSKSVKLVEQLPGIYRMLAEKYDCAFLDASFIETHGEDGVHLTAEEHNQLGTAIISALQEVISL